MNLSEYFNDIKGTGILATSNPDGHTNAAVYSRPYLIDDDTVAFSMLERRSYSNIQSNPRAAYMFIEDGSGHKGVRLYLEAAGEETDPEKIAEIKAQHERKRMSTDAARHLVYFKVTETRPLVGEGQ